MSYAINWITEYLGVGRAPMSYEEFDSIRDQGVNSIVNLCHEYSDLHELEEQAGFEVYYLPTYDEYAPDLDAMEKGLEWLDEALYLKKKVLVHCRFGQGRTGTFTSAYLLRRGLDLKGTKKELKKTKALPSTYRQWKALKRYGKLQGAFTLRPAQVDHGQSNDIVHFYAEYQLMSAEVDKQMVRSGISHSCGKKSDCCCHSSFNIPLLEALYLVDFMNRRLTSGQRTAAINRALACREKCENSLRCVNLNQAPGLQELYIKDELLCPLSVEGSCILYEARPIRCRANGGKELDPEFMKLIMDKLAHLSNETFFSLAGQLHQGAGIYSSLIDAVSGKFIQTYFHLMAASKR